MNKNDIKNIQEEKDFVKYVKILSALKEGVVIIAVKDTIGFSVQADGYEALHLLGLSKFNTKNGRSDHWRGYLAVIENGRLLFERIGRIHEPVFFKETVSGVEIDAVSAPLHGGNTASILVNGKEYGLDLRGFNFVLISADGNVRDSVAFDTHLVKRQCTRSENINGMMVLPHSGENLFNRHLESAIKRLDINYITNGWCKVSEVTRKIKVRLFFFGWYVLWTAVESLMEEFEDDSRYDILIIMETKNQKTWDIISRENYRLIYSKDYDIVEDCPDIMIYNSDIFAPKRQKSTVLSVYVSAGLNDGGVKEAGTNKWIESIENTLNADLYVVEKHLAKKNNWYGVGNPKFDIIYRNVNSVSKIPSTWNKLRERTVILWAPDHKWAQKDITFDLYARSFFEYFQSHVDMGLIIRMHPSYLSELIGAEVWSEDDVQRLIRYANSFPNIVWDDRKDYGLAYSMADAVLTDINCGITISSLPLNVPVAVLLRYDGEISQSNFPDEIEGLYQIHSVDEAYSFFSDVKNKKDPLKEKRNLIMRRYVANFDGKNGARIKKLIEEKYFDALCKKEKEKQNQLINSLIAFMPDTSVALYLGNGTSREAYLALSLENRQKIFCIIDKEVNCACADLNVPIVPLEEAASRGVRSILVVARTLPDELKDFLTTQGHGIHVFGLYGWFDVNGYHTKHNFYDFAIQSMDAPLPSPLAIPDFLHFAAPDCPGEISVVMLMQDESTLLSRLYDILRQISLGIRIYCLDMSGKAAEVVKDYQKVESAIEIIQVDEYHSLPVKLNELISFVKSKYICFLSADEHLHAKGLSYLHEVAEKNGADVASGAGIRRAKDGDSILAEFSSGAFELKKEAHLLPATFNDRYKEWQETDVPSFTGNRLYRVAYLRQYNISFPAIKSGWQDIFCLQTIFESPKYVKAASSVCISIGRSIQKEVEADSAVYAKELVESMFAYQQAVEKMLRQMNSFGNNVALCDMFRERAMTIFDQQYFSGLALDDEMRKAVSQTVQEKLQKNPSIGIWWIKYLFMRSSFPQNV